MFCVREGDHLTLLNAYRAFIRVSASYAGLHIKGLFLMFNLGYSITKVLSGVKKTISVIKVSLSVLVVAVFSFQIITVFFLYRATATYFKKKECIFSCCVS